jgi:nucleotide-binding universal stress UspA family protein
VEIPVDLSQISASALRQGLDFLARIGVPLTETEVLFVLDPLEVVGSIQFTPEQIERFADGELHSFLAANSPGAVPPLTAIRNGYPRQEILAVLKERQVDLAIFGTHGRSGFARLTLGSVVADVMRHAGCNLLIVPPEASLRHAAAARREEERAGADWQFVSDEVPLGAGRA